MQLLKELVHTTSQADLGSRKFIYEIPVEMEEIHEISIELLKIF